MKTSKMNFTLIQKWGAMRWEKGSLERELRVCSCAHRYMKGVLRSYLNCNNCLGYGIPPIPWSEVR